MREGNSAEAEGVSLYFDLWFASTFQPQLLSYLFTLFQ